MLKKLSNQIVFLTFAPLIALTFIVVGTELFFYYRRIELFNSIRNEVYQ